MNDKPTNAEDRHVYFVSVRLGAEVHVVAQGFTSVIFEFAFARTPAEAECLAHKYCADKKLTVLKAVATYAVQQDLSQYLYPEKILRDHPLADLWRGEVVVHSDQTHLLTKMGAQQVKHLGEHVFVFSAPEEVAVHINSSNARLIGMLKPFVAAGTRSDDAATATA